MGVLRWGLGAALATLLVTGGCGGGGGGPATSPYVLAPDEMHYGASYGAWSARWWQWALEMETDGHPLYDTTGADAWKNQIDPVWFIGGIFGSQTEPSTGQAERTVTMPSGIALFFPIICTGIDNVSCIPPGWTPQPITVLRQIAYDQVSAVEDVYCIVDGVRVIDSPDLSGAIRFRAIAPQFGAWEPEVNVGVTACGDPLGPVTIDPIASDGIWMMLGPMDPGEHDVRFGGTFPNPGFHLDIVYHITVTP